MFKLIKSHQICLNTYELVFNPRQFELDVRCTVSKAPQMKYVVSWGHWERSNSDLMQWAVPFNYLKHLSAGHPAELRGGYEVRRCVNVLVLCSQWSVVAI